MSQGWPLASFLLEEQRRSSDFHRPRVCGACGGRGRRRKVLVWRGWRLCRSCWGRGMLGGR